MEAGGAVFALMYVVPLPATLPVRTGSDSGSMPVLSAHSEKIEIVSFKQWSIESLFLLTE